MHSSLRFVVVLFGAFACNIAALAAPFDDCSGAELLTPAAAGVASCTTPATYDAAGSTQSRTYASCDNNFTSPARDVWFRFIATTTSHILIIDGSSSYQAVVEGFGGSCSSPVSLGCNTAGTAGGVVTLQLTGLTPGNTYYFRVYHRSGTVPATTTFTACLLTPPANDECSGAINLTANAPGDTSCTSPPVFDANLAAQTRSYASCDNNFTSTARDVWFKFTATATSHTMVVAGSASYFAVVEAFRGSCTSLTSIGCNSATASGGKVSLALNGLTPNSTYWVRVYHRSSSVPVSTTFSLCLFTAVTNDECAQAIALTPNTPLDTCALINTYLTDFSSQTRPYAACDNNFTSPARDVWFNFTATATSHTLLVDGSASYFAVAEAFSGSCTSLTSIGCATSSSAGGVATLFLAGLTVNSTYWVRVYHRSSSIPATTGFSICLRTAPVNDECVNAQTLTPNTTGVNSCSQPVSGNSNLASSSRPYATCDNNFTSPVRDIWYRFTATASSHTIKVDGSSSYFPVVETFSGNCGSLTSIGCAAASANGGSATLQVTGLTIGNTYYTRVYHRSSVIPSTTTFSICVLTAPANDESCNARLLVPNGSCVNDSADAVLASQSKTYASCDNNFTTPVRDVWFRFTAASASHSVRVDGSASYFAVVQAYSGSCASLSAIGCAVSSTAGGVSTLNLNSLIAGSTYYVRVYHRSSAIPSTTTFTICVVDLLGTGTTPPTANISVVGTPPFCAGGVYLKVNRDASPQATYQWKLNNNNIPGATDTVFYPLQSGSYTVEVNNPGGTATSTAVNVTVYPLPAVTISAGGPTTFCEGGSVLLDAGPGFSTYRWSNQSTGKTLTAAASDSFTVEVTDVNGCKAQSGIRVTVKPVQQFSFSRSICTGESFAFNGQNLKITGTYRDTVTASNGCDSIVTLSLQVVPEINTNRSVSICAGETFSFGGAGLTAAGTYRDTLSAAGGCDSIIILELTVNALPVVSWTPAVKTFCAGGPPVSLNGGTPGGGTYTGTGVSGGQFSPTDAGNGSHVIEYSFTDNNSCTASATDTFTVDNCTGAGEINNMGRIRLFPNPATEVVVMESGLFLNEKMTPWVYDLSGQLTGCTAWQENNRVLVNVSTLAPGVYFICFTYADSPISLMFVK